MQIDDKGRDRTKVPPFFYFCRKKITGYLQRRLFKEKVPVKKGGGMLLFISKNCHPWQF